MRGVTQADCDDLVLGAQVTVARTPGRMNPRPAPSRSACDVILPWSRPTTRALYTSQLVSRLTNYVRYLADTSSLLVKRVVRFSDRPRYRTIQIHADPHTVTTADPLPQRPPNRAGHDRAPAGGRRGKYPPPPRCSWPGVPAILLAGQGGAVCYAAAAQARRSILIQALRWRVPIPFAPERMYHKGARAL